MNKAPVHQILFVQGAGEGTHDQWDNKLVNSLQRALGDAYEIRYPEMPNEDEPDFNSWSAKLEHEFASLANGAILIGHSVGGTILINTLARSAPTTALGAIVLIAAPFVGEGGWPPGDVPLHANLGAELPKGVPVLLYHGDIDTTVPVAHLDLYAKAIPGARAVRLPKHDHQLNNDLTEVAAAIRSLR